MRQPSARALVCMCGRARTAASTIKLNSSNVKCEFCKFLCSVRCARVFRCERRRVACARARLVRLHAVLARLTNHASTILFRRALALRANTAIRPCTRRTGYGIEFACVHGEPVSIGKNARRSLSVLLRRHPNQILFVASAVSRPCLLNYSLN